jgi:hypothetical protein
MVQNVRDEIGTFSFSTDHGGGTITWKESYTEGWVRRRDNWNYSFVDHHGASPEPPARAMQNFYGRQFKTGPNNTLTFGNWKVCCWDFTMTATFDMRNAWRDDWTPLPTGQGNEAVFGGAGNHSWQVDLTPTQANDSGLISLQISNTNDAPLYGFAKMLFPGRAGAAPPVGFWWQGPFHAVSNDTWAEDWKSGQEKPRMRYVGGYT